MFALQENPQSSETRQGRVREMFTGQTQRAPNCVSVIQATDSKTDKQTGKKSDG